MKKIMKMFNRRFALVLCSVMLVGNIPVSASAEGLIEPEDTTSEIDEIGEAKQNIVEETNPEEKEYDPAAEEITILGLEGIQLDKIEYTGNSTESCQGFLHNWQVIETIQEQTCGKQGIWRIKCTDCNVTATTFSDIYDHNYVDGTCINCGDTTIEVAPESELDKWNYTLNETDKTITLTRYKGSSTDVIVYGRYKINGINFSTILNGETKGTMSPFYSKRFCLKSITINSGVTSYNCTGLFYGCVNLTTIDLSSFDTSKVTSMARMFLGCYKLKSLDLSSFDTSNVTTMQDMFYLCFKLTTIDLSSFDTSKVTSMARMFLGCYKLKSLDLSSFDTSKANNMNSMFRACYNLSSIYVGSNWDTTSAISYGMFTNCGTCRVTLKE